MLLELHTVASVSQMHKFLMFGKKVEDVPLVFVPCIYMHARYCR